MRRGRQGVGHRPREMKKTVKASSGYDTYAITYYIGFVKSCGNFSYFCIQLWSNTPKIDRMNLTRTSKVHTKTRVTNTTDARGEFCKSLYTIIYLQYYHIIRTLLIVKLLRWEITTLVPELHLSSWIYYKVYDILTTYCETRARYTRGGNACLFSFTKKRNNIIIRHKETDPFFDRLRSCRSAIYYCQTKTICSSNNITTCGRSGLEADCFCQLQNTSAEGTTNSRPTEYTQYILNNIVLYSLRKKRIHQV